MSRTPEGKRHGNQSPGTPSTEPAGIAVVVSHTIPPEFLKLFREATLRISQVDPLLQDRNGCKSARKLHATSHLRSIHCDSPFQTLPISQPFRDGEIWYKSDEIELETTPFGASSANLPYEEPSASIAHAGFCGGRGSVTTSLLGGAASLGLVLALPTLRTSRFAPHSSKSAIAVRTRASEHYRPIACLRPHSTGSRGRPLPESWKGRQELLVRHRDARDDRRVPHLAIE